MSIEYTVMTFTRLGDVAKINDVWYKVKQHNSKIVEVLDALSNSELHALDLVDSDTPTWSFNNTTLGLA